MVCFRMPLRQLFFPAALFMMLIAASSVQAESISIDPSQTHSQTMQAGADMELLLRHKIL